MNSLLIATEVGLQSSTCHNEICMMTISIESSVADVSISAGLEAAVTAINNNTITLMSSCNHASYQAIDACWKEIGLPVNTIG